METLRVKDQGSGSRIRIKDQDQGSRIRIKDRDQGSGSRIGIKDRDQGLGSRIGIKDPFLFLLLQLHLPPPKPRNLSHSWIQRQCLPSLSPIDNSRTFLAQFDLVVVCSSFENRIQWQSVESKTNSDMYNVHCARCNRVCFSCQ